MMNFLFKMMNCLFKMMNFVFKLMKLVDDARRSHLVSQWRLTCPKPHGLATLGGVIGLLRLRGTGIMAAAAGPGAGSNARTTAAVRSQRQGDR